MAYAERPGIAGAAAFLYGLLADRPAFGNLNTYYWATDNLVLYRDTGVAWEVIARSMRFKRWIYGEPQEFIGVGTLAVDRMSFFPFEIEVRMTINGIIVINGGTVGTDSWRSAFFDSGGVPNAPVNRLALGPLTLTAGATQRQYLPFAVPVTVDPGLYYGCMWKNGNTDNHRQVEFGAIIVPIGDDDMPQWYYESNAGGPPAIATPTGANDTVQTVYQILRVDLP